MARGLHRILQSTYLAQTDPFEEAPLRHTCFWIASTFVGIALASCGGDDDEGCAPCESKDEYCVHSTSDVDGRADDFRCEPLPDTCVSQDDCSCLEGELEGELATCLELGGCHPSGETLVVTCPGG